MAFYHYIVYPFLLLIGSLAVSMTKDYIEISYLHKKKVD